MLTASLRLRRGESEPPVRSGSPRPKNSLWPDPYPGTEEPCLRDMLEDDVLRSLMACDGIAESSLHALVKDTRQRLGN